MSKWLLLIPTEFEFKQIESHLSEFSGASADNTIVCEVCGFGPVTSAAKTSQLLNNHKPDQVLFLGIAGAYLGSDGSTLEIGSAHQFASVACYGIGVGSGKSFQTAEQMGWSQSAGGVTIDNPISLSEDSLSSNPDSALQTSNQLLTVCAASDNSTDVEHRQTVFPDAIAEDMEGFSVATACQLHNVKLTIVRGISNVAGDRNKANWKIAAALNAAFKLSQEIIVGKLDSSEAN